jgi:branched-subunit amino acid aminotransferase/4-amino-4-deoxychorismate lyase
MTNSSWVWNGAHFVEGDAISLTDRGVRYGMSLFETLRVVNGHALFLEPHLRRLADAASQVGWPMPEGYGREAARILSHGGFSSGMARVYLTAGNGGVDSGVTQCGGFIFFEASDAPFAPFPAANAGWAGGAYTAVHPGLKTGNYWANQKARHAARLQGLDEVLLLGVGGEVVSASMANVFAVIKGTICTPSLASGARPGVVREWVISRRDVVERRLERDEIAAADELFLTSSGIGVRSVGRLGDRQWSEFPVGSALANEYFA